MKPMSKREGEGKGEELKELDAEPTPIPDLGALKLDRYKGGNRWQ